MKVFALFGNIEGATAENTRDFLGVYDDKKRIEKLTAKEGGLGYVSYVISEAELNEPQI